jgi:hypothetical protein
LTTNYIFNKVPHKKLEKTSCEICKGIRSFYKYLKVWGYLTKVAIHNPKIFNIRHKYMVCVFIGYSYNSGVYLFLVTS